MEHERILIFNRMLIDLTRHPSRCVCVCVRVCECVYRSTAVYTERLHVCLLLSPGDNRYITSIATHFGVLPLPYCLPLPPPPPPSPSSEWLATLDTPDLLSTHFVSQ